MTLEFLRHLGHFENGLNESSHLIGETEYTYCFPYRIRTG